MLHHSASADGSEARQFWYDEYVLNAQIGRFSKPYVALMDGIVMGGGVGVSAHGSVRVVTDTTKMAMPEVGIGLIPDVGGTLILSRAPGLLGLHVALTGAPFGGADAIAMGFADHFVHHDTLGEFKQARHRRRHRRRAVSTRRRAAAESTTGSTELDRRVLRGRNRRGHRRGAARPRRGAGQRRGQPDRHPLPDLPVRHTGGDPAGRQTRDPGRRTAPGISDVVRMFAQSTNSSKVPARRSSTRTAIRSGRLRRWRPSPPPTSRPTSRRPIANWSSRWIDELRDHPGRPRRARRHHHAEPPEGAQRAQQPGDARSHHRRSRIRQRPGNRRHHHHRQREGLRGGRRHQGDVGTVVRRRVRARTSSRRGRSWPRSARR